VNPVSVPADLAASAVINVESMPPLRKHARGTSETSRRVTAFSSSCSNSAKAETFRELRESIAGEFFKGLSSCEEIELPCRSDDRLHSWHLFPIKLRLERLRIERNEFIEELRSCGITCSVHWRPVHMHPYYERMNYPGSRDLRNTEAVWPRLVSLPIFPDMSGPERRDVIDGVAEVCDRFGK
jgi:dTDP-4-amino-4,6-dideoxygalactose transaminase